MLVEAHGIKNWERDSDNTSICMQRKKAIGKN